MATVTMTEKEVRSQTGNLVDVVGPDHGIVGSPHLHLVNDFVERRVAEATARRRSSGLQHLHERQGSSRRPLHHEPDLGHLRR